MIDMRQTYLIDIFQISTPHMFFEETAEIFRLKRGNLGNFWNRNLLIIMLLCIFYNRLQKGEAFVCRSVKCIGSSLRKFSYKWQRSSKSRLWNRSISEEEKGARSLCAVAAIIFCKIIFKISSSSFLFGSCTERGTSKKRAYNGLIN